MKERDTQNRIIELFHSKLGYSYLGNWENRENSNIEESLLLKSLQQRYSEELARLAILELNRIATNTTKSLYEVNKEVYQALRYGIAVKEKAGEKKQTVFLIDWSNPEANDFGIAEEVTIEGKFIKRPDIVLYINGIAIGVIELKKGAVSVEKGIRQNLDNQKSMFIQTFFNTMQLVMAGNDSQGLRYGTINTPERYYLEWKEDTELQFDYRLDRHLYQLCNKQRIIEILHDFILFDGGTKKICRPHQYFGVKAAQQHVIDREGGIIWHTQGSGKSLSMVWLANWIRENIDNSRVLIITDREELDKQIVRVFGDAGESMTRAQSGDDLVKRLNKYEDSLLCSLIHKFGNKKDPDYDGFMDAISKLPEDFEAKGDIYVFVDECHRTQSGKLHTAMKEILPGALFIGFTGTPLLKKDKATSLETFGPYIHTYKFNEAIADNVVLDLQYEARDIDQHVTAQDRIDQWFETKTQGLTDLAKEELMKKWGTMQKILSSKSRLERIVTDIMWDFETKDRLNNGQGNAILVSGSVYQACQYYQLFQSKGFKECAIITSYEPHHSNVKGESTGEGDTENIMKYDIYKAMLNGQTTEAFEEEVKDTFINQPARLKLLIVVDKLLTGFDAPPATYLYIDKKMQDHGLFQAICRVNRPDPDSNSKDYGYIIDYKDLFRSLEKSIHDYTTEALDNYDSEDVEGLLKDRLETAKENLDNALEQVIAICEPVNPQTDIEFRKYFCGDPENKDDLKEREELRETFYKVTVKLIRAYAQIAGEMKEAGYSQARAEEIKSQVKFYTELRDDIKYSSGDYVNLKAFEPGMRRLIDDYISADHSKKLSAFEDMTLIQLIVEREEAGLSTLPENIRKDKRSVAETIENNLRKLTVEQRDQNPVFYDKMSELLSDLIRERKRQAEDYETYLKRIIALTKKIVSGGKKSDYPSKIETKGQRALYDNLEGSEDLAILVHDTIQEYKLDGWKGDMLKEQVLKNALIEAMPEGTDIEQLFELIKNQDEY
ncbi:HsdR family type I site-specific deoxyribonuclease [bacterium]|nr:HsdR family type I site-specific deoxyribonuclease [bacterium]